MLSALTRRCLSPSSTLSSFKPFSFKRYKFTMATLANSHAFVRVEDPLKPLFPVIDAHHHFWDTPPAGMLEARMAMSNAMKVTFGDAPMASAYLRDEYNADISRHNVKASMYVECHSFWNRELEPHLRPTGETKRVQKFHDDEDSDLLLCQGIVSRADLGLATPLFEECLTVHQESSCFRGIRYAIAHYSEDTKNVVSVGELSEVLKSRRFHDNLEVLAGRNLTYDVWLYHTQIKQLIEIAVKHPSLTVVADHCCTPVVLPTTASSVFSDWKRDIRELAACPNVVCKIGGLLMQITTPKPEEALSSDGVVHAVSPYVMETISVFGSNRCIFESNFPMDRCNVSFGVMLNGRYTTRNDGL
eukprot:TRINITY_DN911_c1_g1_i2.p1 TRINITY_DN911_c1_g1~~TRINITY_DN911_c1_g1_i2.p1  ORF type:complete len:359 (+),score=39.36 TRINITY_DN911_c1_g1_i2:149-1225(+)